MMAKSKSNDGGGAKAKQPPAKAAGKSKSAGKGKPAAPGAPHIDTALAAQTAARFVGAKRTSTPPATPAAGEARESAAFKSLKQTVNQPVNSGLSNILDKAGGSTQRQQNQPAFGGYQSGRTVGRNQTFGADVNRAGVPRRTGGG
jgi:hypothetical protein